MNKSYMIKLMTSSPIQVPKLLLDGYTKLGISEEACMLILQLHRRLEEGERFPTPEQLARPMNISASTCAEHLRRLVQRGLVAMVADDEGDIYSEKYSLQPLWERLLEDDFLQETQEKNKDDEGALYSIFESEFGRPLSPIECETMGMWVDEDHHTPELIKAALREAVISGKLNFRYIDRILFEWKKNGVKTIEQAKAHGEKIRSYYKQPAKKRNEQKPSMSLPMYNWLDK